MRRPTPLWLPIGLTFAWVLIGLIALPFGGLPAPVSWADKPLYWLAMLSCAAVCAARLRRPGRRAGWALIVMGGVAWVAGDAYFASVPPPVPIPSWADLGYLLFYPCVVVGLHVLRDMPYLPARTSWSRRATLIRVIDGLAVALAINAAAAAVTFNPVSAALAEDSSGSLFALSYPVLSAVLLAVLVNTLALREWVARPQWWWLAGGVVSFWLSDVVFAAQTAAGSYLAGDATDAGWLATFGFFAAASLSTDRSDPISGPHHRRQVLVPSIFAGIALAVLTATAVLRLNGVAIALAGFAMLAVLVRLVLTLMANEQLIQAVRQEARTDALTGLANRRALLDDLHRRCQGERTVPFVLALFDLDGFKAFNDTFGHPEGDNLLCRLGQRLSTAAVGGRAYRLGGDEYCVILPAADSDRWRDAVEACLDALAEEGAEYRISASGGFARVPEEVSKPGDILQLADLRMYAIKNDRPQRSSSSRPGGLHAQSTVQAGRSARTDSARPELARLIEEASRSEPADLPDELSSTISVPDSPTMPSQRSLPRRTRGLDRTTGGR